MSRRDPSALFALLRSPALEQVLVACRRHAIDNSGALRNTRQARPLAEAFVDLALDFLTATAGPTAVIQAAQSWAEQGLTIVTTAEMLRALNRTVRDASLTSDERSDLAARFTELQLVLLPALAEARELGLRQAQEETQKVLHHALHTQLERQRGLRYQQEQSGHNLRHVLQLNADLARLTQVEALLEAAVAGLCRALELDDATIFEIDPDGDGWRVAATTAATWQTGQPAGEELAALLERSRENQEDILLEEPGKEELTAVQLITPLRVGRKVLGALAVSAHDPNPATSEIPLLVTTFALNLAALWQNLRLFQETRRRARDLEILHGRYVDTIWYSDSAALSARYHGGQLALSRGPAATPAGDEGIHIPLIISDYPLGNITLPEGLRLNEDDAEFVQTLIREMGNALNNAYLLQATRAYSNQLQAAADVARAASTILDRDRLVQEVVELIRNRFDLYYVGLFLIDEERQMAVLQAGSGKAGEALVRRSFALPVGGQSLVGQVAVSGAARIVGDVETAAMVYRNTLLPDSRSEMALPLRGSQRAGDSPPIGVLTVHSSAREAFTEEDRVVYQTLADQLATAIENARLFDQTQANLRETDRLYETSRTIAKAGEAAAVYEALIAYAATSELVDQALIIAPDPESPDYAIFPVLWSRTGLEADPQRDRFHRDRYPIADLLERNALIVIEDGLSDPRLNEPTRRLLERNDVRAAVLVPIYSEDQWLATLALNRFRPEPLAPAETQPFITLADQAATILANLQLLSQANALYRVSRALHQALTREDAVMTVLEEVVRQTGVRHCRFVVYEPAEAAGHVVASYEGGPATAVRFTQDDESLFAYLRERRGPLLLGPTSGPGAGREYLDKLGVSTALIIPATSQQELLGFLALDSFSARRSFSRANINFMQSVVEQLTIALESLKLFDDTMHRAQELVVLNQIGARISGTLELNRLAQIVYEELGRLLDNTIFILALYDHKSGLFEPVLAVNDGQPCEEASRTLAPGDPLYQFFHEGQPRLARRPDRLITVAGSRRQSESGQLPQSCLWMPMLREGVPIGLISVQSYRPNAYRENEIQLLRTIATQTGLAVSNAQLFGETQANVEKLQEVDRLKTQFLANMSHELRTPLNSIIGFSRIMLKGIDGPITPMQQEDLNSIHHSGQHLLNLINEILDLAKIEAGRMTLVFETVDLAEMAHELLGACRGLVQNSEVALVWNIAPDLPLIEADPVRLQQVLLNLLSNAAKFTESGEIGLEIAPKSERWVHFAVADTGIGIAEADQARLFEAFQQADASPTRARGGTGLGLSITQRLVHLHQGEIWFESSLDQGTTFHVLLPVSQETNQVTGPLVGRVPRRKRGLTQPLRPPEESGAHDNGHPQSPRPFILVVDDEPEVAGLYRRYLRYSRYELLSAGNVRDARLTIRQFREQIALILLDINLPDESGWELLTALRGDPSTATIPVIICTVETDRARASKLGAQALLTKPILEHELLAALTAVAGP